MNAENRKLTDRIIIALVLLLAVSLFTAGESLSATAKEIDASVDVALDRFYKDVKGAKEFAKSAKALLVLPGVIKGGFVFAGEYGEGAMRIGGKTVDYYNIASASFGLTIGAQKKDIIIAFMTDEALKKIPGYPRMGSGGRREPGPVGYRGGNPPGHNHHEGPHRGLCL